MILSSAEAELELLLLNSKTEDLDRLDVLTFFINAEIPQEIILRLEELWDQTKVVGTKIIHIGRIIILEIIRFSKENINLAIGVALGAAVGALINIVPFLGPLLSPLTITIGAAFGGVAGSRLDRGQKSGSDAIGFAQDVIELARKFFELLASIFVALGDDQINKARINL